MTAPANDNWASASLISGTSGSTTGDNTDATSQGSEPIPSDGGGDGPWLSVWWKWVAPSDMTARFSTAGSRLADDSFFLDTVIGVYTGASLAALVEVASNDDYSGLSGNSRVDFAATSGVTYYLQVSGYDADQWGPIALAWAAVEEGPPPPPDLADCFLDEVMIDAPTGFWMPGSLADPGHVIDDLSGNSRDMTEVWTPTLALFRTLARLGIDDLPYSIGLYDGSETVGDLFMVLRLAAQRGLDAAPPTITAPDGWTEQATITASGFFINAFDDEEPIAYRLSCFAHRYAGEPADTVYTWGLASGGAGPFDPAFIGTKMWQFRGGGDIAIESVDLAALTDTDDRPSFSVPDERYLLLTSDWFVTTAGVTPDWAETGAAWPSAAAYPAGPAYAEAWKHFDWLFADESPPSRGLERLDAGSTALTLTAVFDGFGSFWTHSPTAPFCETCAGQPEGSLSLISSLSAFTAPGVAGDYFGANGDPYSLELVARFGPGLTRVSDDVFTPNLELGIVTPPPVATVVTPASFEEVQQSCWHHAFVTYTPTTMKVYIDGALAHTGTPSTTDSPTVPTIFGSASGKAAAYAVYDHVLTADRIAAHFAHVCQRCPGGWRVGSLLI